MKPLALKAAHLHKTFSHPSAITILKGANIEVEQGTSVAIMGRSGEGKTTLLHILGTLEPAQSGTLEIAGQPVSNNPLKIRNRHIGFVFQGFHLLEDESALQNVLMPARIARKQVVTNSESYNRAIALLEKVGLSHRIHFNVKSLSGGEKQRVAIARALMNDPELLLADEPTGNLDRQSSDEVLKLLLSLVKDEGKALVIVTHDPLVAKQCDETLFLQDGLLINI